MKGTEVRSSSGPVELILKGTGVLASKPACPSPHQQQPPQQQQQQQQSPVGNFTRWHAGEGPFTYYVSVDLAPAAPAAEGPAGSTAAALAGRGPAASQHSQATDTASNCSGSTRGHGSGLLPASSSSSSLAKASGGGQDWWVPNSAMQLLQDSGAAAAQNTATHRPQPQQLFKAPPGQHKVMQDWQAPAHQQQQQRTHMQMAAAQQQQHVVKVLQRPQQSFLQQAPAQQQQQRTHMQMAAAQQ